MTGYLEYIRQSHLFDGIGDDEIVQILNCLGYSIRLYRKDKVIAMEGNDIRYIGIVLQGAVDMVKEDLWGNKDMLTRMLPGDLFGETFACGIEAESVVTFVASATTEALIVPFNRVLKTCSNACGFHEKLIRNFIFMIARKNKALMQKLEVVTKKSLREKILAYLSQQAQEQQAKYIQIPLGRKELADYLCADRSSLTRELSGMKKEKIIDFERNTFRIY